MHEADSASRDDGSAGVPLTEVLDTFYATPAPIPVRPSSGGGAPLVDQLPAAEVTVRSRPFADVLRPAYAAFHASAGAPGPSS